GSAITGIHSLRPNQQLHNHTEHAKHDDRFQSARTQPQKHHLLLSFHAPQHVIREYDKAHHRADLVTLSAMSLADCDGFFYRAVITERKPDKSDGDIQDVVAQNYPKRQQDSPPRPMRLSRQFENS